MRVAFECPSCGVKGVAEEEHVGREVRCKQCKHRFVIRRPDDPGPNTYDLEEPPPRALAEENPFAPAPDPFAGPSTFVPTRGDRGVSAPDIKDPPRQRTLRKKPQPSAASRSRLKVLAWVAGLFLLTLVAVALFAPRGLELAGMALLVLGSLMVMIGYTVGLFAAFREDMLYGFFYAVFAPYTAYYMLTRLDDLWPWLACSTVGVGFVFVGTEMLRWAGAAV